MINLLYSLAYFMGDVVNALLGIKPTKPKKTISAVRLRKGDVYKDDTIIGVKFHWDSEQVTITRSDGSIGTFDFNQDFEIEERK